MKQIKDFFGFWLHRKRIVQINMKATIDSNFESCVSVFRGFFGEPYVDSDMFTCYKDVTEINKKKLYDANVFTERYGFKVYSNRTERGTIKVHLIPSDELTNYLIARTFNEEYHGQEALYRNIR